MLQNYFGVRLGVACIWTFVSLWFGYGVLGLLGWG